MPQVQCHYCGLPFKVRQIETARAYYCCSGCALASRLPRAGEAGQFPVTAALVTALGVGAAFFNEMLFWTLAVALAREQRAETAAIFVHVSAGLGVLVWIAMAASMGRAPARRWTDLLVALATLAGLVAAAWPPLSAGGVALANAGLALWMGRGWCKPKLIGKKTLPI